MNLLADMHRPEWVCMSYPFAVWWATFARAKLYYTRHRLINDRLKMSAECWYSINWPSFDFFGQVWGPEDPGGEHGEGLLDGAHQDGGQTRIEAGPRIDEDVHHVRCDHVDPRPLGDHHQGPDPLEGNDWWGFRKIICHRVKEKYSYIEQEILQRHSSRWNQVS